MSIATPKGVRQLLVAHSAPDCPQVCQRTPGGSLRRTACGGRMSPKPSWPSEAFSLPASRADELVRARETVGALLVELAAVT